MTRGPHSIQELLRWVAQHNFTTEGLDAMRSAMRAGRLDLLEPSRP